MWRSRLLPSIIPKMARKPRLLGLTKGLGPILYQRRMTSWRRKRASLVFAMNDSVKWWFWTGGLFKLISDVAQITSPLLVKVCFSRALAPRSL